MITVALLLAVSLQSPAADRGATNERGRQELRLGHLDNAEVQFRGVLAANPADVDARIGLGMVLTRKGDWRGALDILVPTERDAGENGDYFAALARAFRRAGDDRRAYEYFRRAVALSPGDPELRAGYENAAMAYGHAVGLEGFGQQVTAGSNAGSGTLTASVRSTPRLHVLGQIRTQTGSGFTDVIGGGGVQWRAGMATMVTLRGSGGAGNVSLARIDLGGDVIHYVGPFEVGGGIRDLAYADVDVTALSATTAWDRGERWRFDGRYTYSRSRFDATGESSGDHSVLARPTFRATRRVWLNGAYAYGIESFEDLTADRIGALGSTTAAGGVRIGLRSLTLITGTWEHQWRSNDSALDRVTLALVQYFP